MAKPIVCKALERPGVGGDVTPFVSTSPPGIRFAFIWGTGRGLRT